MKEEELWTSIFGKLLSCAVGNQDSVDVAAFYRTEVGLLFQMGLFLLLDLGLITMKGIILGERRKLYC